MEKDSEIKIFHTNLNESQRKEEDFFASDKSMCSVKETYKQILWKCRAIWMLDEIISKYKLDLKGKVLEVAGGYGVQAAYLKARYKEDIYLCYSDCSITAVRTSCKFENFFEIKIDEKWVVEAENLPASNDSFDKVLFFAGFHHVQNPEKSILECYRALKVGGELLLLLEPCSPRFFKRIFEIHTKRDEIKEKSYTKKQYEKLLENFSNVKYHNYTNFYNRESKRSLIYYLILSLLPNFLVNVLPCSQVIIAKK